MKADEIDRWIATETSHIINALFVPDDSSDWGYSPLTVEQLAAKIQVALRRAVKIRET